MKVALNYIIGIILLVSLILNCILVYKLKQPSAPEVIEIVKNDTIVVTKNDTIFKERIKYVTTIDTAIIFQHDSIIDTIYVTLPDEHKEATFKKSQDSIDLEAKIQYHGYKAEIDSVKFAYQLHYTQEVPKPKQKKIGFVWFIGPSASGGVNFNINNRTFDYGPSLGISIGVGVGGYIETKSK